VIDLHTHSTVSDGSDPPARIPELAEAAGCRAVALTDHDRLDGVGAAGARAAELGIAFVPGVEVSCQVPFPGSMHLLVYWVEPGEGPLQDALVRLQDERAARNRRMVDRLAALGLPVTWEDLVAEVGDRGTGGIGRPHVAQVLVRTGVVGSQQEAFDRYLAKGRPAYVNRGRLSPGTAITLACASRAVPVLAHPLSTGLDPADLEANVAEWAALGLGGVESIYGRYTPAERAGLTDLAHRTGLVATGGSDHHGSYKPDLRVGVGRGDLDVPDRVLDDLAARRPA